MRSLCRFSSSPFLSPEVPPRESFSHVVLASFSPAAFRQVYCSLPLFAMIIRLSKLAALGVLFIMISGSHCSNSTLRGALKEEGDFEQEEAEIEQEAEAEIEYVTMEEIMAELELQDFFGIMDESHRKLADTTCWHGGQSNQVLTWLGVNWGSCQNINPCVCGLSPRAMGSWCPNKCRSSCGGSCATPSKCPRGFNVNSSGSVIRIYGTPSTITYPPYWPPNWGTECYWYRNAGAPVSSPYNRGRPPTPPPTRSPQYNVGGVNLCKYMNC